MDFYLAFGFTLVCLGCSWSDARSIKAKIQHEADPRQGYLWEDACPPMPITDDAIARDRNCTDTCNSDDYCTGRQLCCLFDGCRTCMEPVLPPAVIDWLGSSNRGYTNPIDEGEQENTIILTEPHYEEVECVLDGKTYTKGVFYQGCRKCLCNVGGYITCELQCKGDKKKIPTDEEVSGSGEEDDTSSGNPPMKPEHLNQIFPVSYSEDIKRFIRPDPVHLALDQPQSDIVTLPENGGESESGDDEKGTHGSGDSNIELMKQKHSINHHEISTLHEVVDQVPKVEDIFLVR